MFKAVQLLSIQQTHFNSKFTIFLSSALACCQDFTLWLPLEPKPLTQGWFLLWPGFHPDVSAAGTLQITRVLIYWQLRPSTPSQAMLQLQPSSFQTPPLAQALRLWSRLRTLLLQRRPTSLALTPPLMHTPLSPP